MAWTINIFPDKCREPENESNKQVEVEQRERERKTKSFDNIIWAPGSNYA